MEYMHDLNKRYDDIKQHLGKLTHKNKFDLLFNLPNMKLPNVSEFQKTIRAFVRTLPVPSVSVDVHQKDYFDKKFSSVFKVNRDNIIMTMYDTKELEFHTFFNAWVFDKYDKRGSLIYYPDDYKTDIVIENYEHKIYQLNGVHPINVGDFIFSHDDTDSLGTFDVTFNVDEIVRK